MNNVNYGHEEVSAADREESDRSENQFKKLKRPVHASKRSQVPERLHGMHRRRRKRIEW